ncbi:hypothetical protein EK21DRAFT_29408, partial [Setomelanomma holmii]
NEHKYSALSYAWGAETPTYPIQIDGRTLRVRENLWDFLLYTPTGRLPHFSDSESACYLWIEQICIDQASNTEKNYQVSPMSEIYRGARKVILWLGKETKDSFACMNYWEDAGKLYDAQNEDPDCARIAPNMRFGMRFRKVIDQPYWSRLWIIRGFALAHQAI